MNCPSIETLLASTEGSLEGPERESVERHVAGCPRCAAIIRKEGALARGAAAAASGAGWAEGAAEARSSSRHPDEIDLARLVEGTISERERDALLGHVVACAECRTAVSDYARDLRGLESEPVPADLIHKGLALSRPAAPPGEGLLWRLARFLFPSSGDLAAWLRPAAAVAVVLVAIAIVPRLIPNPEQGPDEGGIRDGSAEGELVATSPAETTLSREDLAAGRVTFAWTKMPGPVSYRAVLAADDGSLLLDTTTPDVRWTPSLDAGKIASTRAVLFWVEASSGGRHSTSATRTYDLR